MAPSIEAQSPPLQADRNGVMRVGGTRVTLDTLVRAFDEGHTAEEFVSHFPALRLADVYCDFLLSEQSGRREEVFAATRSGG